MTKIVGPPENAIRCLPISDRLRGLLNAAADENGIDTVVIVSGGQTSNHAAHLYKKPCGWTGSRRHDNGGAADIEIFRRGEQLTFTDRDGSKVARFVTACAAHGATGIGAGEKYMGNARIHVGFGSRAYWGADQTSRTAPEWLQKAVQDGWKMNGSDFVAMQGGMGRSVVTARDGVWLRFGPGLAFDKARLLEADTPLSVVGFDGDWARIDLVGDGRIDGHVLAAFISPADSDGSDDADGHEDEVDATSVAALLGVDLQGPSEVPNKSGRRRRTARPAQEPEAQT